MVTSTNIKVAVRVRPFLPFEAGSTSCIDVLPGTDEGPASPSTSSPSTSSPSSPSRGRSIRIASSIANRDAHTFTFDQCFSGAATQSEIYDDLIQPLLSSCLEGYNATALAYGQTGAGKTYTTLGPTNIVNPDFFNPQTTNSSDGSHSHEYDAVGILPRTLRDLFTRLEQKRRSLNVGEVEVGDNDENSPAALLSPDSNRSSESDNERFGIIATKSPARKRPTMVGSGDGSKSNNNDSSNKQLQQPFEYQVKLQFLELYGEEIRDLLATPAALQQQQQQTTKIVIRDSAGDAEALGATTVSVANAQEAMVCLTRGMLRRVTGATAMNAESSRSHAIMSVMIEQSIRGSGSSSTKEDKDEKKGGYRGGVDDDPASVVVLRKSKFNFVDLAGSERSKRTNAKGQRLKEGININKGLSVLGNVISALASGNMNTFVPFRDSKLTRLLRGSLGGNHKTLMIACASPSLKNAEESLNCLRYANRAKNIQNVVTLNVDPHSKLVYALRGQVSALAGELLRIANRGGGKVDNDRFTLELLETLVNGGKDSQAIIIGEKGKVGMSSSVSAHDTDVTAELENLRQTLKDTQRDLLDKSEKLEAVISERDKLRRMDVIDISGDEPIKHILSVLATEYDDDSTTVMLSPTSHFNEEQKRIKELSSEVERLSLSVDHLTKELDAKSIELETTKLTNSYLREMLRTTPDIDDETIHCIIQNVISFDNQRIEECDDDDEEEEEEDASSVELQPSRGNYTGAKREELVTFGSVMFSTGKFLVDRHVYGDSVACFETVVEVRRELYGWDDTLVGDALHMEGFSRTKMGDYDRALCLLWDALRIRKLSSEPLKLASSLRLLADLHFSKNENMHAALFYEECALHLKEHNMADPHLPLVLIDLARTKDRLGEYVESMNFFEEALSLYEKALDHDDELIASLQYEMGVLAFQMGERNRGEQCFRQFIRIRKTNGNKIDEGVASALFVLGSLHWAMKKRDDACACWTEALEIFKALGRPDEDAYVKSLTSKLKKAQRRPIARLFRGS